MTPDSSRHGVDIARVRFTGVVMLRICLFTYDGDYTGEPVWEGEKGGDVLSLQKTAGITRVRCHDCPLPILMGSMVFALKSISH